MISFCIITDSEEPEVFLRELQNIIELKIPEFEIIVSGNVPSSNLITKSIQVPEIAKQGRIGLLRNLCCREASGDIMVVLDDDMIIFKDFYEGILKYGNDFDVLSCRILNPDGTRYWDWKTFNDNGNRLLDYNENHPDISLTGGLTIMKSCVFQKVQWDEIKGFYQCEDVDFSNKLKAAGFRINFNKHSTIMHSDPRFSQKGNRVWKISPFKNIEEQIRFMEEYMKFTESNEVENNSSSSDLSVHK